MKNVQVEELASTAVREEHTLPEGVQQALGELVSAAKEGLLALSVGVGLGVMHELMQCEVEEACGPRGKHDPERVAYRHGSDDGQVTLGGRGASRWRVRGCAARTAASCRWHIRALRLARDALSWSISGPVTAPRSRTSAVSRTSCSMTAPRPSPAATLASRPLPRSATTPRRLPARAPLRFLHPRVPSLSAADQGHGRVGRLLRARAPVARP